MTATILVQAVFAPLAAVGGMSPMSERSCGRIEGLSHREVARRFGIDPRTVAKMIVFLVPLRYRRSEPPARPKLDPFFGIIDRIVEEDKRRPAKQRRTSKRIFERLGMSTASPAG